jgi:glucose-6-phosphate isomerase
MKPTENISLDISLLKEYITERDIETLQPKIDRVTTSLFEKTCQGNEYLGWLDLPTTIEPEIEKINTLANEIKDNADHMVSIGIGGSYLGARSAIDFLADPFIGNNKILYFGHQIGSDYTASLLDYIMQKNVYVNIISKSGTTTEPAIAFRLIREALGKKYSKEELQRRIIATTDNDQGVIREMANSQGFRSFSLNDDIGGRFSVLSPVGLLPIAVAGYDIKKLIAGARDMAAFCRKESNVLKNVALKYAAARYSLYQKGKDVEIFSSFEPSAQYLAEWWKQLYGESEGKDQKGIYPTSALLTTDLHSLGQFMQEGTRTLFETFLTIDETKTDVAIPSIEGDPDQLNFLGGDTLKYVNKQAYIGTKFAHFDGDLPNMTIQAQRRDEYCLGQLFYFFQFSVAISGLLLGVNPFNQPGVEAYKQNMFALLDKPGFEERKSRLQQLIKGE